MGFIPFHASCQKTGFCQINWKSGPFLCPFGGGQFSNNPLHQGSKNEAKKKTKSLILAPNRGSRSRDPIRGANTVQFPLQQAQNWPPNWAKIGPIGGSNPNWPPNWAKFRHEKTTEILFRSLFLVKIGPVEGSNRRFSRVWPKRTINWPKSADLTPYLGQNRPNWGLKRRF